MPSPLPSFIEIFSRWAKTLPDPPDVEVVLAWARAERGQALERRYAEILIERFWDDSVPRSAASRRVKGFRPDDDAYFAAETSKLDRGDLTQQLLMLFESGLSAAQISRRLRVPYSRVYARLVKAGRTVDRRAAAVAPSAVLLLEFEAWAIERGAISLPEAEAWWRDRCAAVPTRSYLRRLLVSIGAAAAPGRPASAIDTELERVPGSPDDPLAPARQRRYS